MASSIAPTFLASLRAVGTAATMAGAGFYLHRRDFVTPSGKKMLALISQQVTIPAFLFAKIIYCPSGGSAGGGEDAADAMDSNSTDVSLADQMQALVDDGREIVCPSVASRINDLWIILFWPFYVVLCGLLTGYLAAKISRTPPMQIRSCLAACAFGNSTGLPITLLSVIHKQFRNSKVPSELGRIDPTAFLSVYLLLYPVLQWGAGGWLLAPEEKKEDDYVEIPTISQTEGAGQNGIEEARPLVSYQNQASGSENGDGQHHRRNHSHISHILNYEPIQSPSVAAGIEEFGGVRSRRIVLRGNGTDHQPSGYIDSSSGALAMMVRELSFSSLGPRGSIHGSFEQIPTHLQSPGMRISPPSSRNGVAIGERTYLLPNASSEEHDDDGPLTMDAVGEATVALAAVDENPPTIHEDAPLTNGYASTSSVEIKDGFDDTKTLPRVPSRQQIKSYQEADILPLTETLLRILRKVFQPPVIGAVSGLFIASFPHIRGVLQNIWGDESYTAPMQFMFDGIYSVGQAAVPINMIILGINLSSTFQKKKPKESDGEKSKVLTNQTMLATVFGKMIVMPVIGMVSTWLLQKYYIAFPDEIDATCYLVMMIVFITPTANNVMVMVELSGSSSKEGMARLIGWQYAISPLVLSVVLSVVVSLASCHFDASPLCSA